METDALVDHVFGDVIDNVSAVRAGGTEQNRGRAVSWSKGQIQLAIDAVGKAMRERRLKFPPKLRRRMYTDRQKAEALQILSEINDNQRVSERTGVPRSTLNRYRHF